MMHDSILARSFSKYEQKRLGYGASICCLIILLLFCTSFKPLPNPLNLKVSMGVGLEMFALKAINNSQQMLPRSALHENKYRPMIEEITAANNTQPLVLCDTDDPRTELCEIKTYAMVDAKSSSVFVACASSHVNIINNNNKNKNNNSFMSTIIRPYARKDDRSVLRNVRKWSVAIKQENGLEEKLRCTQNHTVPAVLFSFGGYFGNIFHAFSDVIIPLFVASRQYNREVQFLISDSKSYSVAKHEKILKGLSKYKPINIDNEDQQVHCFPSLAIGLRRHKKELAIDPEKDLTSMREFREFLRSTFSLSKGKAIAIRDDLRSKKPRLLILSRKKTRAFTNPEEISAMAQGLGYDVVVSEAGSDLERFSEVVNSCDVLMGVHGAGLTNMMFLPDNAVFIQIVPFGSFEWLAKTDYELPSKGMNLNYLEYKISIEESTLINQYPADHEILKGSYSTQPYDWSSFKSSIFMDKQDVNVDVNRFKPTLVKALELLHI